MMMQRECFLRVVVTTDAGVVMADLQARLAEIITAAGTEHMPSCSAEDLTGGPPDGPRVYWQTARILQGSELAGRGRKYG